MEQRLSEFDRKIDTFTTTVGDFNNTLSIQDETTKKRSMRKQKT